MATKTYREKILIVLTPGKRMSLSEITTKVASRYKMDTAYLSGSFSTLLSNMIEKSEVFVDKRQTGPRGGKMYYTKKR